MTSGEMAEAGIGGSSSVAELRCTTAALGLRITSEACDADDGDDELPERWSSTLELTSSSSLAASAGSMAAVAFMASSTRASI